MLPNSPVLSSSCWFISRRFCFHQTRIPRLCYSLWQKERTAVKSCEHGLNVFLGAHPFLNNTLEKHERLKKGEKPNPFIDRDGWLRFLANIKKNYDKIMADRNFGVPQHRPLN